MPFRPTVVKAGADHFRFVITPHGNDWTIGGIRKCGDGFEQRADFPASWARLSGEALEEASGVQGALFCHNGRFIAAASRREAAIALAAKAVGPQPRCCRVTPAAKRQAVAHLVAGHGMGVPGDRLLPDDHAP